MTNTKRSGNEAIALRPVVASDTPFLLHLFAETRELEHRAVDWSEGEWDHFVRMQFRAQRTHYERVYPTAEHSIILHEGEPAGRLWVWESDEQLRLLDIAILASYRRRGIGTHLIRGLLTRASAAGKPLRHMVEMNNPEAMRLYERLGFVPTEQRGFHWLMEWNALTSGVGPTGKM